MILRKPYANGQNDHGGSLSIVIPWCDRRELETTLSRNGAVFREYASEVLIVNCGGSRSALRDLARNHRLPRLKLVHLRRKRFNKSLAANIGTFVSHGEHILLADADIVFDKSFFLEARAVLREVAYARLDRVVESSIVAQPVAGDYLEEVSYSLRIKTRRGAAELETNRIRFRDSSRSATGVVMFKRTRFEAINGANSDLEGWGWEDIDLLLRLQLGSRLPAAHVGSAEHLTHGDRVRSFRGRAPVENEALNYAISLANYQRGNFRGTYRKDIADSRRSLEIDVIERDRRILRERIRGRRPK